MIAQTSLPGPVPFGVNYYLLRLQNYIARHTIQNIFMLQPPDYYLIYGDKYCRRFRLEMRSRFSPAGQAWIDKTCLLLQQMLEQKRAENPQAFARLEENASAFRSLAYSQHAAAYIQGGIANLPLHDLILIVGLVDLKDLVSLDGLSQTAQVLAYLVKTYLGRIFDRVLRAPTISLERTRSLVGAVAMIGLFAHMIRHAH